MHLPDSYLTFFVVTDEFSIFLLAANFIIPSNCSAPGCRSNYDKDERISVFKLPQTPDQLRHAWLRALPP